MTTHRDPLAALANDIAEWVSAGPFALQRPLDTVLRARVLPLVEAAELVKEMVWWHEPWCAERSICVGCNLRQAIAALTGEKGA